MIAAAALAAALTAAASGQHPTAEPWIDPLITGAFAAAVVLGAAAARPVPVLVAALGVSVVAADVAGGALAAAAAGALAAVWAARVRSPEIRAVVGAVLVHGLLRLDGVDVTGGPALVAAAAGILVLVAGLVALPSRLRRLVMLAGLGLLASAAAATGLAGAVVLGERGTVDGALMSARAGLAAVREGDRDQAADRFAQAARAFDDVAVVTGRWWMAPARVVPVVAQHVSAVRDLARAGADLASAAAAEVAGVDTEAFALTDGQVDLAAFADLETALERTGRAIERAEGALRRLRRDRWLVDELSDRVDRLAREVDDAKADSGNALEAVRVVPGMLGADGPRRYLLAVNTLAELRASGGFVGNWGEITAVDGRLELTRFGRIAELDEARGDDVAPVGPPDHRARYPEYGAHRFWGNLTASPDFPTVAEVAAALYPRSGGAPLDGVIAVDPVGLAAVLQLTGPVPVESWPEPLSADNAGYVLLHEQYLELARPERADFLGDVARAVWMQVTRTTMPGPAALGRELGPAVAGRHLQLVTFDPSERRYLDRLGLTGAMPPVRGDFLALVTQNASANKLDYFLHRFVDYAVSYDPASGRVTTVATIRLENRTPTAVVDSAAAIGARIVPPGWSRSWVSLYSPLDLVAADLDGEAVPISVQEELGRHVYSLFASVPPGGAVTLRMHLSGLVGRDVYRLDLGVQPLVHPDQVGVRLELADGWELADARGWNRVGTRRATTRMTLDANGVLVAGAGRTP